MFRSSEDLYAILGVDEKASREQLKEAYRRLTMQLHPDKLPETDEIAESRFRKITEAYRILSDEHERRMYSKYQGDENPDLKNQFENNSVRRRLRPNLPLPKSCQGSSSDRYQNIFMQRPVYSRSAFSSANSSEFEDEEEDTLGSLIGEINVKVYCTLEEIFFGTKKLLKVARCRDGVLEHKNCIVTLYPGIETGTEIVAPGQGNKMVGKPAENIVFKIVEIPHPRFCRDGHNLYETITISLKQALVGFKADITGIDKKPIHVEFHESIGKNLPYHVPGRGMVIPKTEHRGDYVINFRVEFPTQLTEQQRKIIETLF